MYKHYDGVSYLINFFNRLFLYISVNIPIFNNVDTTLNFLRNSALEWLFNMMKHSKGDHSGVIYFAETNYAYNLKLFEEV